MKGRIRMVICLCVGLYIGGTCGYGAKHMEASPKRAVYDSVMEIKTVLEMNPVLALK